MEADLRGSAHLGGPLATPPPAREPPLPFRAYAPGPGHPDWQALARDARRLATAIAPRLDRPQPGHRRLLRRASAARTVTTNYVENRRRHGLGRDDLLPLYFIWTVLRPCNFRCTYCDDHRGERYPDLSARGCLDTAQGKRLLEVMRTATPAVYFAGGEPTLRPDLPELVRHARDLDYYPIVVNTNGSLIRRRLGEERWRSFFADVDVVVVSLDALRLDLLAGMWGVARPEEVISGLLLLRELADAQRFRLLVNTVVQPGHVAEARAVLALCEDLGIGFCPVPRNRGARVDPAVRADPEYAPFVAHVLERHAAGVGIAGSRRMNARLLGGAPLDCHNTLKPHVDHDGRLAWPCKATVHTPPVWLDVLAYPDVPSLWAAATALRDPKGFHGPGPDQCGGACNWAQNYTTDEYAYGLRRPVALARSITGFLRG